MNHTVYNSKSDEETQKAGQEFAGQLKSGDIVLLYGDLGFGKTTFTKGIAKGLGADSRIMSPTFPIIRTHPKFYHIDLYRIDDSTQLEKMGLAELFEDPNLIKVVEWAEKLENVPEKRWDVRFQADKENNRVITITKHD